MRIAFVGKGGAGKSTVATSFALYLAKNTQKQVMFVDADLNIHAPELMGFEKIPSDLHLSHPQVSQNIKTWLIGENVLQDLGAFKKTTPPTRKSNIINISDLTKTPLINFGSFRANLSVFAVGTYQEADIGASCYHNNLSLFENLLSHLDDHEGFLIADMVAGVDSFAGTLHAQFDLVVFVAEPTHRSMEVLHDYFSLADTANVQDSLIVIGNKVRDQFDEQFIKQEIPNTKLLGLFKDDPHIRAIDRTDGTLDHKQLLPENQYLLEKIKQELMIRPDSRNERLQKLYTLHQKYTSQTFVTDRYGDLKSQIDPEFKF